VLFKTKMLYQDIRGALKSLRDRSFEYWDENHYTVCGFINKATYVYGTGMIIVEVDNQMWDVLSDFTKGFRRFELNKALALPTSASLQFYMIVSGQQKPFDLSIEELKNWLGISPDKYKKDGKDRVDHLEERVLRPVMKILDDTCPYSFTYKKLRKNEQNSKSPVIGFRFVPVKNEKNRDQALEKASLSGKICVGLIAPQITDYMKYRMGIPSKSLAPHKELIMKANRLLPDFIGTLADIQGRRRTKDGEEKGIGWVIQAIRGEVENAEKVPNKGK